MDGAGADHDEEAVILLGDYLDGGVPAVGDDFFGFGGLDGGGELRAVDEGMWAYSRDFGLKEGGWDERVLSEDWGLFVSVVSFGDLVSLTSFVLNSIHIH